MAHFKTSIWEKVSAKAVNKCITGKGKNSRGIVFHIPVNLGGVVYLPKQQLWTPHHIQCFQKPSKLTLKPNLKSGSIKCADCVTQTAASIFLREWCTNAGVMSCVISSYLGPFQVCPEQTAKGLWRVLTCKAVSLCREFYWFVFFPLTCPNTVFLSPFPSSPPLPLFIPFWCVVFTVAYWQIDSLIFVHRH